jgi:haloalkane dehalogenase
MTPPPPFVRTPDENFEDSPDRHYEPRYVEIDGLWVHYIDEGPPEA